MGGGKKKPKLPSLNKFMHPKNPYKTLPSFKELAIHYPEFRAHCTFDFRGKAFLDFKKREIVEALTTCLFHKDFGLKVKIPANRLVPTLPLRMNYLLWIEDLLNLPYSKTSVVIKNENVVGIDIGTGAACVYPLLGSRKFEWNFVATETDSISFESAKKNVIENELEKKILIKQSADFFDILMNEDVRDFLKNKKNVKGTMTLQTTGSDPSTSALKEFNQSSFLVDFTMCNPPFFSSEVEMDINHNSKNETRSLPRSVSTGSTEERVTEGGEVSFIDKLIDKSLLHKDAIRIFSTLVGRKADVKTVLNHIKEKTKGLNVCITDTEFCQGRTMRWGVAWSFLGVPLDKVISKKKKMAQKPYVLQVPRSMMSVYSVQSVWAQMQSWLKDIKIKPNVIKLTKYYMFAIVKAYKPTWRHQRQKRRQKMEKNQVTSNEFDVIEMEISESPKKRKIENEDKEGRVPKRSKLLINDSSKRKNEEKCIENDSSLGLEVNYSKSNEKDKKTSTLENNLSGVTTESHLSVDEKNVKTGLECYLKCSMEMKQTEALISLHMNFIGGTGKKDALHQLLQYLNNRLNQNK